MHKGTDNVFFRSTVVRNDSRSSSSVSARTTILAMSTPGLEVKKVPEHSVASQGFSDM